MSPAPQAAILLLSDALGHHGDRPVTAVTPSVTTVAILESPLSSRAALYSSLMEGVEIAAEEALSDRVDVLQEIAKTRMEKMESAQAKSPLMEGIRQHQTRIRALEEERAQMRLTIGTLQNRLQAAERPLQQGTRQAPGVPPMPLDDVVPPPGLGAPPPPPPGLGGHALFGPPAPPPLFGPPAPLFGPPPPPFGLGASPPPPLFGPQAPPPGLGSGAPPPPGAAAPAQPTAASAPQPAPEPPMRPSRAPGPGGRGVPGTPPLTPQQPPPTPRRAPVGFKSPTVPASPFVHCEGGACIFGFTLRVASGWQVGLVIFSYEGEAALHVKGIVPGGAIEAWNSQVAGGPAAGKTIAPGDKVVQVNNATDAMGMLKELKEQAMLRLTIVRGDPDAAVDLSAVWSGGAQRVRGGRTRLSVGPAASPATEQGSSPGPDSVAVPSSPLKPDASDFKP